MLTTAFGDSAARLALLAATIAVARHADPEVFAAFVALSAMALFAAVAWDAGFSTLATRELAAARVPRKAILRAALRIRAATFPVWLVVLVASRGLTSGLDAITTDAWLAFVLVSALTSVNYLLLAITRAQFRFLAGGMSLSLGRWVAAVLIVLQPWYVSDDRLLVATGGALAAGEVLTLLALCLVLLRTPAIVRLSGDEGVLLNPRRALPFAVNDVLFLAYSRLDIILVSALVSASNVGEYAVASRLQDALAVIPVIATSVLFPVMSRQWAEKKSEVGRLASRAVVLGLAMTVPVTLGIAVLAPVLIEVLLGEAYQGSTESVRILVWFLPLVMIHTPLLVAMSASGRAGLTTYVVGAAFVTAIAMHFLLDPRFGSVGAAAASLSRDIVAAAVTLFIAYRTGILARLSNRTVPGQSEPNELGPRAG